MALNGVARYIRVLLIFLSLRAIGQEIPVADEGTLQTQTWDFTADKLALSGSWAFVNHELLNPEDFKRAGTTFVSFPSLWNDTRDTESGVGVATYGLTVLLPENAGALALEIPQFYSCYNLWVNGKVIAANGLVGKTKEESLPQWLPQTVTLEPGNDTLSLVLQIANFHHHKGGAKDPIYLGSADNLQHFRKIAVTSNLAEAITLSLVALVFLVIYFLMDRRKVVMYFLLLCLTWALRSVFSNLYVFTSYNPDFDWELIVKIEYLTLYLTMLWALLFLGRLFRNEGSKLIKYLLVIGNIFFIAFTLLTPAITYTQWLPAYLGFSVILIVYGLVIVVMALMNDRAGVFNVIGGVMLGLVMFSYDVFAYQRIFPYNPVVFSIGYIVLFLLLGTALMFHLRIFKSKSQTDTILTFDDLYKEKK